MIIEVLLITYLKGRTSAENGVDIELPEEMPEKFILIDKTGSTTNDLLTSTTVAIQSYAASKAEAMLLNEEVKRVMGGIVELDEVSACKLNSDYDFTDPTTKRYRYQAVFQITHY